MDAFAPHLYSPDDDNDDKRNKISTPLLSRDLFQ